MEQATGQDFAPLKRQEANLIATKEALQNQQSPLAKAEATFAAPTTWKETAGNVANVVKDPKTTVTQTFLRESPATKVSTLLQKSLDDLPESATSTPSTAPQSQTGSATPPQPSLGKGPIPTVQGTPVSPFPSQGPPRLGNPQGQIEAPLQPRSLPSSYFPPRLPASTGGFAPAPDSPPPPLNPDAARMRIQPNQFSQPEAIPSRGPIPVSPSGNARLPTKGLPAPTAAAPKTPALSGKALWAQKGAEKMSTHGVSDADIDALNATSKGKQLLVIASSLSPGSQAMKNLVRQIAGVIGK